MSDLGMPTGFLDIKMTPEKINAFFEQFPWIERLVTKEKVRSVRVYPFVESLLIEWQRDPRDSDFWEIVDQDGEPLARLNAKKYYKNPKIKWNLPGQWFTWWSYSPFFPSQNPSWMFLTGFHERETIEECIRKGEYTTAMYAIHVWRDRYDAPLFNLILYKTPKKLPISEWIHEIHSIRNTNDAISRKQIAQILNDEKFPAT